MSQSVLRLLEFETGPSDDKIEALVGDSISPNPEVVVGLSRTIVGRRLTKASRLYLVATVWVDREAMMTAIRDGDVAVYQESFAPYLGSASVAAIDIETASWSCDPGTLFTIHLIRGVDSAVGAANPPGEPVPGKYPRNHARRPPCLMLTAGADEERVVLSGWSDQGRAGAIQRLLARARARLDRIGRMSQPGSGIEYEVIIDRASP